jgi:hypothetical protein
MVTEVGEISSAAKTISQAGSEISRAVRQISSAVRDISEAAEEFVSYPQAPRDSAAIGGGFPALPADGRSLTAIVDGAFRQGLGISLRDAQNVQLARKVLGQRFPIKMIEGRRVVEPRTGAPMVASGLGGQISGDQFRLWHHGQRHFKDIEEILDRPIRGLRKDPDQELIATACGLVKDRVSTIVSLFAGEVGILRATVDQEFAALLDREGYEIDTDGTHFSFKGDLGLLEYALGFADAGAINTVEDEQVRTQGHILRDVVTSLRSLYEDHLRRLEADESLTLGSDLATLSQGLAAIAESRDEVIQMLASARVGPSESRTVTIPGVVGTDGEITISLLLSQVESFEFRGQRLIEEAGLRGVAALEPMIETLVTALEGALGRRVPVDHPFRVARVRRALKELRSHVNFVAKAVSTATAPRQAAGATETPAVEA